MKLEKLAHFQSELTFLVKWSPDLQAHQWKKNMSVSYQNPILFQILLANIWCYICQIACVLCERINSVVVLNFVDAKYIYNSESLLSHQLTNYIFTHQWAEAMWKILDDQILTFFTITRRKKYNDRPRHSYSTLLQLLFLFEALIYWSLLQPSSYSVLR